MYNLDSPTDINDVCLRKKSVGSNLEISIMHIG